MSAQSPVDSAAVWNRVVATIESRGVTARDRAFLRLTQLVGLLDSTALLAVPYQHTKDTLETTLRQPIVEALASELGHDVRLAITVDEDLRKQVEDESDEAPAAPAAPPEEPPAASGRTAYRPNGSSPDVQRASGGAAQTAGAEDARLNPKYTFDTFVSGSSNRFAHAASLAVAESPARAYNPLFIYGESGLGKTHLLHAIGHYARSLYPGVRVRYVNSEEFTNDFINSIRDDKAGAFQRRYRNVDFLLVDDIQFLQGKEQTVEEFFHTFNTLHNSEKQVVITSDQPPKRLSGFAERMRSRFEWGLLTDVQPPDLETRIAILKKKAAQEGMQLPDEVLELIGSKISTNIRELEGALIRVTAFASLSSTPPDAALASHVLKDIIPSSESAAITVTTIMAEVADYFSISMDELCGTSRSRTLVNARQIAMYLCRELTDLSLPKIGQEFGGRDHTTVMHAERKIRQLIGERRALYDQITELTGIIRKASAR
ncbi:chromosomal replication initiator protein DnaA [Ornithinimicrobium humiphilum]|uniref:chromosomal replication initiator protein DnaA n=1 Tax=Ornithinimicrobium humiphilum TaxID=125288 RepID=UPI001EE20DDE|nr:chromosomal replication initiator protein DnaA [Ornithinimicrobium humiphilum]